MGSPATIFGISTGAMVCWMTNERILMSNVSFSRLLQASTTAALIQGVVDGSVPSSLLLGSGNFGLGTFEHLDGEMVILNGNIYQICADGEIKHRLDKFMVPFAQVCDFNSEQTCSFREIANLDHLETACDLCRTSDNLFYAFRIDATFDCIRARTVRTSPHEVSLESAGADEVKFSWTDISGSIVGFWSPAYSSSFSVPGYHFHFISDDRKNGGHLLDCSLRRASPHVQVLNEFEVVLPTTGRFLSVDLNIDTRSVLRKVE